MRKRAVVIAVVVLTVGAAGFAAWRSALRLVPLGPFSDEDIEVVLQPVPENDPRMAGDQG